MGRKGDKMRIIKVFAVICFLTIGIFAQQGATLTGNVRQDKNPAGNAIVALTLRRDKAVTFTTTADENGNYRFDSVPPGMYTVSSGGKQNSGRAIGVTASADVNLQSGANRLVDLELISIDGSIRETVTISEDSEQTPEQVSKTVNVIDAQELRDRADFSLPETLRTIPGFRVQQFGGFGRLASIKSRGLRNQDTAILIDGIRFRDAGAITGDASSFLSDFTLTSVSKIEVLRGPGSSLYGTNAIGGTVDFQTPQPRSGTHGQVSFACGDYGLNRFRGNFSDGMNDGTFAFTLAVSRTVYTEGLDGEDDAHNTNFQSRIEYKPFSKTNISARFFVSDAYVRLNSSPDTFGTLPASNSTIIDAIPDISFTFDANDPDNFQKSKFFNGQIVLNQIIYDNLFFEGFYSGLKTSRKNDNGILGPGFQSASASFFDGTIQTANGRFRWTPNEGNKIAFGYEFEHEKYGNNGLTPDGSGNFFTRSYQSSNTFYVQDLLSLLNGKLQLAGGFRTQFFSLKSPQFSLLNAPFPDLTLENPPSAYTFDVSASYFLEKTGTKIRAHAGNGYRVPSLFERLGTFFSTFPSNSFVALGDPNLKPERSIAFDAAIERNLFDNRAKLTATYFYTKLTDIIGFGVPVPNIGDTRRPFGGYENQKGGIARGAEFSGEFRPTDSTDIFASYTYTNSDQREPQVPGTGIIRTLGIPTNQFTLVATQRFRRFWINFDLLMTSDYLAPIFDTSNLTFQNYIYRFKGNRRADLTAGYTFPLNKDRFNLRLFGTIENLFDYEYYENGFRTVGRNGRIGLRFGF